MKKLFLLLTAGALIAQPVTITHTTSGSAFPGAAIIVTANLSGSSGLNIAGIGATLPAGATSPALGAASTTASKTLWSSGLNLLLIGDTNPPAGTTATFNATPYADGALLSFTYTIPTTATVGSQISIGLPTVLSANTSGNAVVTTVTPTSVTVVTNPCMSAISSNVSTYLLTPTISTLGQIVTELVAVSSTGTCH